jgi:hypothetical protein
MDINKPIYIFISHSHRDLEKVRVIRNYLESLKGCETLLFFLLSVDDDDLINKLIKDEIKARIWFVYCDSENARKSAWVKSEIEYAKAIGKNNFIEININESVINGQLTKDAQEYLLHSYKKFVSLSKIFISYNYRDFATIQEIITTLSKYNIFFFNVEDLLAQLNPLESYSCNIQQEIEGCNFVLSFLGKASTYQQHENKIAYRLKKKVIPVFLDDGINDLSILENDPYLMSQYIFIFDVKNMAKSCDRLIKYLFDMTN